MHLIYDALVVILGVVLLIGITVGPFLIAIGRGIQNACEEQRKRDEWIKWASNPEKWSNER